MFLLTTLNTHFIGSFSVSISFKQSKHALNIDSNGHRKKNTKKRFKTTTKNIVQKKHVSFTSLVVMPHTHLCRGLQFLTCTCLIACTASYQHLLHLRSGFSALRMQCTPPVNHWCLQLIEVCALSSSRRTALRTAQWCCHLSRLLYMDIEISTENNRTL